jgi:pimeloyl-ACP methyl ester carboxylesterase
MPERHPLLFVRTTDGLDTAYILSGSGFPFVKMPWFLGPLDSSIHAAWNAAIEGRFRYATYEGRGQWRSSHDIKSFTTADMIADLVSVASAAGMPRFILWANNWYCSGALRFAAEHPGRLAAMVLTWL